MWRTAPARISTWPAARSMGSSSNHKQNKTHETNFKVYTYLENKQDFSKFFAMVFLGSQIVRSSEYCEKAEQK